MAVPKNQWQVALGELIIDYFKIDQEEKGLKLRKKILKNKILLQMKRRGLTRFVAKGIEAVYTAKEKLPKDIDLIRSVLGSFWSMVAQKVISYDINRDGVKKLIERGRIKQKAWDKILIPEETLTVKKAKK